MCFNFPCTAIMNAFSATTSALPSPQPSGDRNRGVIVENLEHFYQLSISSRAFQRCAIDRSSGKRKPFSTTGPFSMLVHAFSRHCCRGCANELTAPQPSSTEAVILDQTKSLRARPGAWVMIAGSGRPQVVNPRLDCWNGTDCRVLQLNKRLLLLHKRLFCRGEVWKRRP